MIVVNVQRPCWCNGPVLILPITNGIPPYAYGDGATIANSYDGALLLGSFQCYRKAREGQSDPLHGPNTNRCQGWVRQLNPPKCTFECGCQFGHFQIWIIVMQMAWHGWAFEAHIDEVPTTCCFRTCIKDVDRQRRYHLNRLAHKCKVECRGGFNPPLGGE